MAGKRGSRLTIPKISAVDREAGSVKWSVKFADGRTDLVTVYRPDPMKMVEILNLDTITQQFYATLVHALRENMEFVLSIHGKGLAEIFLVANGLGSDEALRCALFVSQEIGEALIRENLEGGMESPLGN